MHFMVVREEQSEPQVSSLGDWMAPLLGVTGKREGLERLGPEGKGWTPTGRSDHLLGRLLGHICHIVIGRGRRGRGAGDVEVCAEGAWQENHRLQSKRKLRDSPRGALPAGRCRNSVPWWAF